MRAMSFEHEEASDYVLITGPLHRICKAEVMTSDVGNLGAGPVPILRKIQSAL